MPQTPEKQTKMEPENGQLPKWAPENQLSGLYLHL